MLLSLLLRCRHLYRCHCLRRASSEDPFAYTTQGLLPLCFDFKADEIGCQSRGWVEGKLGKYGASCAKPVSTCILLTYHWTGLPVHLRTDGGSLQIDSQVYLTLQMSDDVFRDMKRQIRRPRICNMADRSRPECFYGDERSHLKRTKQSKGASPRRRTRRSERADATATLILQFPQV